VSKNGRKPDPAKVQVVTDWPHSRNCFDVPRTSLGYLIPFRKVIRCFVAAAAPLTAILEGLDNFVRGVASIGVFVGKVDRGCALQGRRLGAGTLEWFSYAGCRHRRLV
jgi:hypothetical protein